MATIYEHPKFLSLCSWPKKQMVFDIFKVLQSNAKQGILLLPHISNLSLITASLNYALKESPAYYTLHGFLENISKQTNLKDRSVSF